MNSVKCNNCGLKNFSSEVECRRCGQSFLKTAKAKAEKSPRSFSFGKWIMIALLAGVAYYIYNGTRSSVEQVNANDAKRVESQPVQQPATQGLSRSEYDKQRSMTYGQAVKNSSSLSAHQDRIDQTAKAMQQISNTDAGK